MSLYIELKSMYRFALIITLTAFSVSAFAIDRYPLDYEKTAYDISSEYQKYTRAKKLGAKSTFENEEYATFGGNYFLVGQYPYYPYWSDADYEYDEFGKIVRVKRVVDTNHNNPNKITYRIMPYFYTMSVSGNSSDISSTGAGIYLSRQRRKFVTSLAYETTGIGNNGEVKAGQYELAFALRNGVTDSFDLAGGFHRTSGENVDKSFYRANVYTIEAKVTSLTKNCLGVSLHLSQYNSYGEPSDVAVGISSDKFEVKQYSPYLGFGFDNVAFSGDVLYLTGWVDIIDTNKSPQSRYEVSNYKAVHIAGRYDLDKTHYYLETWLGDQRFLVSNDGFVVNNLTFIKDGGATLYVLHEFESNIFVKGQIDLSSVYDYDTEATRWSGSETRVTISTGYSF